MAGQGEAAVAEESAGKALMVWTGYESEQGSELYRVARSQEVFDKLWLAHRGEGVQRAAQGWPMTPQFDFERVQALLLFGGERQNCNGYRVIDVVEEEDATTVRVDLNTYQTDLGAGDSPPMVRPWALLLLPASERTLFVEEDGQGLKNHPARWKRLAAFPGRIGVGRTVEGTGQSQSRD